MQWVWVQDSPARLPGPTAHEVPAGDFHALLVGCAGWLLGPSWHNTTRGSAPHSTTASSVSAESVTWTSAVPGGPRQLYMLLPISVASETIPGFFT